MHPRGNLPITLYKKPPDLEALSRTVSALCILFYAHVFVQVRGIQEVLYYTCRSHCDYALLLDMTSFWSGGFLKCDNLSINFTYWSRSAKIAQWSEHWSYEVLVGCTMKARGCALESHLGYACILIDRQKGAWLRMTRHFLLPPGGAGVRDFSSENYHQVAMECGTTRGAEPSSINYHQRVLH